MSWTGGEIVRKMMGDEPEGGSRRPMRMRKRYVWLSGVDLAVFLIFSIGRVHGGGAIVNALYWIAAFAGLVLAVYGFLVLTRGGSEQMRKSVLCVLFALIPGCIGLVALLSHLGTQPV